jgi:hypothetical protein
MAITSNDLRRAIGACWNLPLGSINPTKRHRSSWVEALESLTQEERLILRMDVRRIFEEKPAPAPRAGAPKA